MDCEEYVINGYTVQKITECFRIFPKNRKGDTIPLTINRRLFTLRRAGTELTMKEHLYRGRLLWNDSRVKGSIDKSEVVSEIARMLFAGNASKAKEFLGVD